MRHGLTKPSMPHSSNPPKEGRVRKVQEYDAAQLSSISLPSYTTNQHLTANSAVQDDSEGELKRAVLGLVNTPESVSLRQPEINVTRRTSLCAGG